MRIPLVKLPFENFGMWKTKIWLKTMWNNLGRLEIELLWIELLSLPLQIEWGTYTMTEFAGLYDMDNRTMRILNRVRLSMEI